MFFVPTIFSDSERNRLKQKSPNFQRIFNKTFTHSKQMHKKPRKFLNYSTHSPPFFLFIRSAMSNWFNGSFQWVSDYCRTIKRLFIDPIVLIQGFQSSLNLLFGNPTNKDLTNLAQANLVISRTDWNQDESTLLGIGKSIHC